MLTKAIGVRTPPGCEPSPKNEFAEGCIKSNSILKLEYFFKPCVLWDYKEKEEKMLFEVI